MREDCRIIIEKLKLDCDKRFILRKSDKSKKIYIPDPNEVDSVYIISAEKEEDSHEDMAEIFVKTDSELSDNLYLEYEKFKKKKSNNSFKDFLTWEYSSLTVAGIGSLKEPEMVCAYDDTKIMKKIINEYLLLGYKAKAPKSQILGGTYGK